jgi:hypothetical protein
LAIELGFFSFAAWALYAIGALQLSGLLSVAVVVHYVASYDRVRWLMAR